MLPSRARLGVAREKLQHLPERLRRALTQDPEQIARFITHPPPEFGRGNLLPGNILDQAADPVEEQQSDELGVELAFNAVLLAPYSRLELVIALEEF